MNKRCQSCSIALEVNYNYLGFFSDDGGKDFYTERMVKDYEKRKYFFFIIFPLFSFAKCKTIFVHN